MTELKTIGLAAVGTKELYQRACETRDRAYAPYSKFKVGAAIRLTTGHIFSGCNVENSSFGATCCAERVAIQKAVSEVGRVQIVEVVVVTECDPPATPCGICRQAISEFSDANALVHSTSTPEKGSKVLSLTIGDLLPHAFDPSYLTR